MSDDTRPLFSVPALAEYLHVSERTAWDLVGEDGPIRSMKIGGVRRVDPRDVDRYLDELKDDAA